MACYISYLFQQSCLFWFVFKDLGKTQTIIIKTYFEQYDKKITQNGA